MIENDHISEISFWKRKEDIYTQNHKIKLKVYNHPWDMYGTISHLFLIIEFQISCL